MANPKRCLLAFAVLAVGLPGPPAQALTNRITVFAASSLARPLNTVIEAYSAQSRDSVRGVYGASGTLADQIAANAPADIFIAAHPHWTDDLRQRNLVVAASIRPLAGNRLVLLGAAGVDLPHDLRRALNQVEPKRIGIADPASVASGHYAMQTLRALNLAAALKDNLLVASNDPAAAGMVERSEIPVAFAYATDAIGIAGVHVVAIVDDKLHDPIVYSAALVTGGQPAAKGFFDYLTGPDAARILRQDGFPPPPAVVGPATAAAFAEPTR